VYLVDIGDLDVVTSDKWPRWRGYHLNISLEVAGHQGPQRPAEGQSVEVREDDGGVEDGAVDQVEGAEIVLQPVPDQDGVGVDEPHQIVLHFLDVLELSCNCN